MCGRYYIDDDTIREMEKLVRQIDKKLLEEKSRDVFPSQSAPVVCLLYTSTLPTTPYV